MHAPEFLLEIGALGLEAVRVRLEQRSALHQRLQGVAAVQRQFCSQARVSFSRCMHKKHIHI